MNLINYFFNKYIINKIKCRGEINFLNNNY